MYQQTTSTQSLIYLESELFSLWLLLPWPKWHQLSVLSWIMARLLNGPYLFSLTFLSLTSLPNPHHNIYSLLSPQQPKYKHYHINPLFSPFHLKKKTVSFNSLHSTLWLGAITISVRMGYKDFFFENLYCKLAPKSFYKLKLRKWANASSETWQLMYLWACT